ncbi:toxin VasX [Psychrobacter sp. FBL11]|uniref:Toxin VasX n=1 Tax=Psychrobacter saeujeotis TaxID=3143436 RepID=A0ABU9X5B2_9GAMM|nr:toxin VasX [uncultured Psychrobacter sp.]
MSSDLSFMDRLTNNHRSYQDKKKSEPVVLEYNYEIPIKSDEPPVEVLADKITVIAETSCSYKCGKVGIPILPVVLSKTDYKISPRDERYFSHSITPIPSSHNAVASIPTHSYLYCYVEDNEGYYWYEYYTGSDGALKEKRRLFEEDFVEDHNQSGQIDVQNIDESDDDNIDEDAQPFTCTEKKHSTLDSKFITLLQGDIAWLMVSHAKLSKSTLRKYIDNEGLRNKRMQKFIADDLTGNNNTVNMSVNETDYIKSFSRRKQLAQDRDIASRIDVSEQSGGNDIVGGTVAATALYRSMERSIAEYDESVTSEIKPIMVALPDPVGEVLAATEKRNYLLKKLDDAQKNESKIREQVNAIIIVNIRQSLEASVEYDSTVPQAPGTMGYHITGRNEISQKNNKNIYNYINQAKFQTVLEEAKKSRQDKADIAAARQIFVNTIKRPEFAFIMREDFPKNDEDSHVGYAQIIAQAIQGIGIDESNIGIPDAIWTDYKPEQVTGMTAKQEFEQSLLTCITGEKPIEDNWLIKALIGLNQEDINRMQDAPTFENLARVSDFIGTATNWAMAFKAERQKRKIKANIAHDIQRLNDLANYKAQVVQTISSNMSHIKDNNKWLYRVDLWTQATVHQATGFKLAQRVLKYSPEAVLKWSEQRLSRSINKAKPHQTLLPASIDNRVVSNVTSVQTPIALDFVGSHGVDSRALDIYDRAAAGDQYARTIVTMYASEDAARATQTVNQDIDSQVGQLNKDLDPISGQYSQLERQSAGKAALVSVGIGLFQLRSIWMGKSSLGSMARRGDRLGLEFMTGYASTTLALTTASLDVANAGLQMKAARGAWVARLSLSVGVLGAVGAGFEVHSLELSQQRMKESGSTTSADAITIAQGAAVTAGVAGFGYGLLSFTSIGAFALPWLGAIIAIAWGVSLIAQWIAFRYDKGNILPVHYWLDAGVFGNRAMLNDEYPNNPFKIQAMGSIEQDMHAYNLALTEIQVNPKFATNTADFRQTLSGQIEITLSQWNDDSELVVEFIGIGNQELGLDRKSFSIETLKRQNKAMITEAGLQVTLDIPKTSHFQAQYLGSYKEGTRDPNKIQQMQEARERAQANPNRQIEQLRVVVLYSLNPSINPYYQLRTTVTS